MHTGKYGALMQRDRRRSNRPHSHFSPIFQRLLLLHPGSFPTQQSPHSPERALERVTHDLLLRGIPFQHLSSSSLTHLQQLVQSTIPCVCTTVSITVLSWFVFQKGQGLDPSSFPCISSRPLRKSSVSHCSSPGQCGC